MPVTADSRIDPAINHRSTKREHTRRISRTYLFLKRTMDLAVAVPASLLTLPLIAALAIGSAVSFRAWPIFTQRRIGLHGRDFLFLKLRSLPKVAPPYCDKYALQSVPTTRWGAFLRRSKLDELPQLWLVVTGRMSLIGPRPEMPALAANFDSDFAIARSSVKPGMTGLWQISTASSQLIHENPEWDFLYVSARSLKLDAWVLARTLLPRRLATLGDVRPVFTQSIPPAPLPDLQPFDPQTEFRGLSVPISKQVSQKR